MKKSTSFLSFWGIFVIVTVMHIALLALTLKPLQPVHTKKMQKIHISLSTALTKKTIKSTPKSKTKMPKKPQRKPTLPPKKKRVKAKPILKPKPLKNTQLLTAPPKKVERVEDQTPPQKVVSEMEVSESDRVEDIEDSGASMVGEDEESRALVAAIENEYINYIRGTILNLMEYPLRARKRAWEGVVEVSFVIMSNGEVRNVHISSPCSYRVLNEATKEAMARVKKFRPLPKELEGEPLTVTVPFTYKLR